MEFNNAPGNAQPAQVGGQGQRDTRYFMMLDNLKQKRQVVYTEDFSRNASDNEPNWNCTITITSIAANAGQQQIRWREEYRDWEGGMIFFGDGDRKQEARDRAAFNALSAIGFQFPPPPAN
ncbi:hypothetical protein FRB99_000570 [Tulasnella sp. 403]|nr:hypothetical protein FRB99_000570 [Tulasnella sp. 403]